jgi:hypothetical protein
MSLIIFLLLINLNGCSDVIRLFGQVNQSFYCNNCLLKFLGKGNDNLKAESTLNLTEEEGEMNNLVKNVSYQGY